MKFNCKERSIEEWRYGMKELGMKDKTRKKTEEQV